MCPQQLDHKDARIHCAILNKRNPTNPHPPAPQPPPTPPKKGGRSRSGLPARSAANALPENPTPTADPHKGSPPSVVVFSGPNRVSQRHHQPHPPPTPPHHPPPITEQGTAVLRTNGPLPAMTLPVSPPSSTPPPTQESCFVGMQGRRPASRPRSSLRKAP
jgi:hypothetical protein